MNKNSIKVKKLLHLDRFAFNTDIPIPRQKWTGDGFSGRVLNDPNFEKLAAQYGRKQMDNCAFSGETYKSFFILHWVDIAKRYTSLKIYCLTDSDENQMRLDLRIFKEYINRQYKKIPCESDKDETVLSL